MANSPSTIISDSPITENLEHKIDVDNESRPESATASSVTGQPVDSPPSAAAVQPVNSAPTRMSWQNAFHAAMAMYSLPHIATEDGGVNPPQALDTRTFANSNYRRVYSTARVPEDCAELLMSVKKLVERYAARHSIPNKTWKAFYQKMYAEAFKHYESLKVENLGKAAEFIWTSAKGLCEKEFCTILNEAIRMDEPVDMVHAAVFSRGLNALRVQRGDDLSPEALKAKFPKEGISYRGSGFRNELKPFFTKKKTYRIPGYLATSFSRATTDFFMHRVSGPCVLWTIKVDPRGAVQLQFRCKQASFVENSHLSGESEFLFAPYSVFTIESVKWNKRGIKDAHQLTLVAALDNQHESECLPLAPWY